MTQEATPRDPATADLIDRGAMGLAAYAAERLLDGPGDAQRLSSSFRWWQSYLASRLQELAAAVNLGQPRLFISQARWCQAALEGSDAPADQFRAGLRCLSDVLANEMSDKGARIAERYVLAADAELSQPSDESDTLLDVGSPLGRLSASFVLAILEGDRRKASTVVRDAVSDGLGIRDAYLKVLVPAAHEIGRMWHQSEVSIAEEHFATSTTQMVMAQLMAQAECAPSNGKSVLAASVAGNRHGLGTQLVADFFELDGWRVVCLGADVPARDIAQAVVDFRADLLMLSAALHTHLKAAERSIQAVRQSAGDSPVRVLVGGNAFLAVPDTAQQIGADAYARDADEAVQVGRRLVGMP